MDTDAQDIAHGDTIQVFLADASVKAAFARLKENYVTAFASAQTPEMASAVWAKMRVFDDILTELAISVQRGAVAKIKKDKKEKAIVR